MDSHPSSSTPRSAFAPTSSPHRTQRTTRSHNKKTEGRVELPSKRAFPQDSDGYEDDEEEESDGGDDVMVRKKAKKEKRVKKGKKRERNPSPPPPAAAAVPAVATAASPPTPPPPQRSRLRVLSTPSPTDPPTPLELYNLANSTLRFVHGSFLPQTTLFTISTSETFKQYGAGGWRGLVNAEALLTLQTQLMKSAINWIFLHGAKTFSPSSTLLEVLLGLLLHLTTIPPLSSYPVIVDKFQEALKVLSTTLKDQSQLGRVLTNPIFTPASATPLTDTLYSKLLTNFFPTRVFSEWLCELVVEGGMMDEGDFARLDKIILESVASRRDGKRIVEGLLKAGAEGKLAAPSRAMVVGLGAISQGRKRREVLAKTLFAFASSILEVLPSIRDLGCPLSFITPFNPVTSTWRAGIDPARLSTLQLSFISRLVHWCDLVVSNNSSLPVSIFTIFFAILRLISIPISSSIEKVESTFRNVYLILSDPSTLSKLSTFFPSSILPSPPAPNYESSLYKSFLRAKPPGPEIFATWLLSQLHPAQVFPTGVLQELKRVVNRAVNEAGETEGNGNGDAEGGGVAGEEDVEMGNDEDEGLENESDDKMDVGE